MDFTVPISQANPTPIITTKIFCKKKKAVHYSRFGESMQKEH